MDPRTGKVVEYTTNTWGGVQLERPQGDPNYNPAQSSLRQNLQEDVSMGNPRTRTRSEAGMENVAPWDQPRGKNIRLFDTEEEEHKEPDTQEATNNLREILPENMQVDQGGDEPMQALARAGGGGGPNTVSKETPISIATPSYGLQETHTTILPWTGWMTVASIDKTTPVQVAIRMNGVWDMVDGTMPVGVAAGAALNKGIYFDPAGADGLNSNTGVQYPARFAPNTATATERPQWRDYWASLYDYYTVLGCEYEIIVNNPTTHWDSIILNGPATTAYGGTAAATNMGALDQAPAVQAPIQLSANAVCAIQYDTNTALATTTGNVMPQTNYREVRYFKNIRWERINDRNGTNVIRGTYKPGQAKRNIQNDGDVKTWTRTAATTPPNGEPVQSPNLREMLTLNFWQDPLNITNQPVSLNMEINLKYIVQFKDLKLQARYPNRITTDQDIVLTLNEDQTAAGNPLARHS